MSPDLGLAAVPSNATAPSRASAPLGAVLLIGLAVVLAAGVGVALVDGGLDSMSSAADPTTASLAAEATADGRVRLVHRGGDAVDVRRIRLRVLVDGTPLNHQPPVPFFSASGFYSGPTGPFNPASEPTWRAGEAASFAIAGTNDPAVTPGSRVVVEVYAGETSLARVEATAGGGRVEDG
ncbi:MAG: type IV pilin [Haloferacaceae archaeon]